MTKTERVKLLLVDDKPKNLLALESILGELNCQLFKASSGYHALRMVRKHEFALILMDVQMPDMDGFETAELMRGTKKVRHVPIIFVTAINDEQKHIFRGYESGAVDYLFKPVNPHILRSKAQVFIELYQKEQELKRHRDQLEFLVQERTAELQAERNLLRTLIDHMPDLIYVKDPQSRFLLGNRALANLLGLEDPAELLGKDDFNFFPRDMAQHYYNDEQHILASGQALINREEPSIGSSGVNRWLLTTKVPVRDLQGEITSLVGIGRDISELKHAEEELRKHQEHLEELVKARTEELAKANGHLQHRNHELMLLNQVGRMLGSTIELDRTLSTILRSMHQLLKMTAASFWIKVPETGELLCQQSIGPQSDKVIGWRLTAGQGLVGQAAQTGRLMKVDDVRNDPRHYKKVDQDTGIEFRSSLSMPFQSKGEVIGVLSLVDTTVGRFTDDDIRLLEPIAAAAASAVENARLYTLTQQQKEEAEALNHQLDNANRFIRKTFGRYLSDEIVQTILETPEGLELGGENRTVTIMMTDLRGFTAISEHLSAGQVVTMMNSYFEVMTDILFKYQATIDEYQGDAILAIFGAPISRDDDAKRAVACALEMQVAMEKVNARNREMGFPDVAMGIGLNSGEVIVGNIGSSRRTKYGIVGSHVNLTARIESYTVGGQLFISESTREACGDILRIDNQMDVLPKGVLHPITLYEVGGIGGEFNIVLPESSLGALIKVQPPISVECNILEGKHAGQESVSGQIVKMNAQSAEIQAQRLCRSLTNLKISLYAADGGSVTEDVYAKVTRITSEKPPVFEVTFTSVPPEALVFFERNSI